MQLGSVYANELKKLLLIEKMPWFHILGASDPFDQLCPGVS
jgi:hypothetical protein